MGCLHAGAVRPGAKMIRRKWIIYERRTRQIISVVFHRRKLALEQVRQLNNYCGEKKYAMQLIRTESGSAIKRHPDIELKNLPKALEVKDG